MRVFFLKFLLKEPPFKRCGRMQGKMISLGVGRSVTVIEHIIEQEKMTDQCTSSLTLCIERTVTFNHLFFIVTFEIRSGIVFSLGNE